MSTYDEDARWLSQLADTLGFAVAGRTKRIARRLAEYAAADPGPRAPSTCRGCGAPLVREDGPGRPREWCERETCKRARKKMARNPA